MSNKNHTNNHITEPSKTLTNNQNAAAKPLPLPSRNEIITRENSDQTKTENNEEGLAALVNNIDAANNQDQYDDQNNQYEYDQNESKTIGNFLQKLRIIVTKIWSPVYSHGKSIIAGIKKLSAGRNLFWKFVKTIQSFCTLKFDDEINQTNESDNVNDYIDVSKKYDKELSQIETQPKSENLSAQKTDEIATDTKQINVTENHNNNPSTPFSSNLYGNDDEIYEGTSWRDMLVKSAVIAVTLLLLVAAYIGIRSIINPQTTDNIAVNEPENLPNEKINNDTNSAENKLFEPANSKTENTSAANKNLPETSPPTTQNKNVNYTNNNSNHEVAPAISYANPSIVNNNTNTTETKNEIQNNTTPKPQEPPQTSNDIFSANSSSLNSTIANSPIANPASANSAPANPAIENNPIGNTINEPANNSPFANTASATAPPVDASFDNVFAGFPSANSEVPPVAPTGNNSPFDNNSSAAFPTTFPAAFPADNTSEIKNVKNVTSTNNTTNTPDTTPPLNNPPLDNSQPETNKIVLAGGAVNEKDQKKNTTEKKSTDKSKEKKVAKSTENFNINPNAEMVPLGNNNNPISVANNQNTKKQTLDNKNSAAKKTPETQKKTVDKKSDPVKIASVPMETLPVTDSKPNSLSDTDSVLRVPPQDYNLTPASNSNPNPNLNKSAVANTSTPDKKNAQPISVTKNKDPLSIVPDSTIQPRFTEATPPVLAKNDALSEIKYTSDMGALPTTITTESKPLIPTSGDVAPLKNVQPTTAFNAEPTVRIPLESPAAQAKNSDKVIPVAPNNTNKNPEPNPNNLTATQPTLLFDNPATNIRNENSNKPNDNTANAKLFVETKNPATTSTPNQLENTLPMPVPINSDNAQVNTLSALLPSNVAGSAVLPDETLRELETLQDNAPAVIADGNPSYRHLPSPSNPAAVQIKNSAKVLSSGASASVYRGELDREITKSPENAELYTVKTGDTYMSICDNYYGTGLLYRALAVHNRNRGAAWIPVEGSQIEIPTADYLRTNYANVLARNNRYGTRLNNTTTSTSTSAAQTQPNTNTATIKKSTGTTYTVRQGDSVFKIAQEQLKDTARWRDIIRYNSDKLQSARDLKPGMEIILPTSTAAGYIPNAH
ncbi:MAG: LysM peptidoglycan-binding domain-containing protein [Planctomycetaceae bacterium]|jgi:hypothetical protein|nr:LysM peptidoglycan-binding domain-containing protein [Planctomycetaceae bacterium]